MKIIDVFICKLRKKLSTATAGENYIQTVWGRGYVLRDPEDAEAATGITLTESLAMYPASSISGFYFAHPESRYFAVGPIGDDQLADYAARTGTPIPELRRWLGL